MKAYPEYKQTGEAWIPDIPAQWGQTKIGAVFTERKEQVSDKDFAPLSVTKMGIVPQLSNAAKTNHGDNRKLVRKGDFVINSRSDRKGSSGVSELDGSVSLINIVLQPRQEINARYFHYLLRSNNFIEEFYRNGHGIVADLWTTRFLEMKRINIPLPSYKDQDQIVSYLDWQNSCINKLVNSKKEQIIFLEEQKQSIIYCAITKGLNETIPKKDSRIGWIGFCPETWRVTCIGHVYDTILGKMLASSTTYEDDSLFEYVCAKDVHFDGVDLTALKKMYFSKSEIKVYSVAKGDLLVVEGGAGAGGAAIVTDEIDRQIMIQNSIHRVRAKKDISINEYLYYWLFSLVKRGYMEFCTNVATIPHYTKEKLAATPMPLPSVDEQKKIVKFLDKKCGEIDLIISKINDQIEKLHEYQTRLISYVVTGQVDVRDVEVPEYETVEEIVDIEDEFIDNIEDIE